jgi:hypothetical protein
MVDVASEFWNALAGANSGDAIDQLPTALTRAGLAVLPADGIGLSAVNDHFRVPLGASDDEAIAAERLQFTVGEGPCLQALRDRAEVRVSDADMQRRWPAFYDELTRRTPYRSVASLPLSITPTLAGAIDLYFEHPTGAFTVDLTLAAAIAEEIVTALRATSTPTVPSTHKAGVLLPAWLYSPTASGRLRTWIAAGVIMARLGLNAPNAVARIRAYAYAHQQDITEITDNIIDGTLPVDALTL